MAVPIIRTVQLAKTYRTGRKRPAVQAVRDLNLEVQAGEIFGFLGPNGAGKTTTIYMLLGLIRPTAGRAELFGRPSTDVQTHRRIGYLPESVNLHGYYRGAALMDFYGELLGLTRAERATQVPDLLKRLGLDEAADRPVRKYSKGMLQRIGFAQALLNDPELLILDEPTSSLDPVGRKEFRDLLLGCKHRGKTVLISSHILSELETLCDRVAILQRGALRRIGTLEDLSPADRTTFHFTQLPASMFDALSRLAVRVVMEEGRVTVSSQGAELRQQLEALFSQHQVPVERLETEPGSLEEIFFSVIEQDPST
jgi:ABC-2 type transport system ATP-binding protein